MSIKEHIQQIREKVLGKDVREAIADALEKAYYDADTSVEMEVIAARGEHETLGDRLDTIDNDLESIKEQVIVSTVIPEVLNEGQVCLVYTE